MYKIFIYSSVALISLFTFTGCAAKSEAKSLSSLEAQVNRVESIVTSTDKDDISSVSPATSLTSTGYSVIQNHKANSYNNMIRENQLKQELLTLNSTLKSSLSQELSLDKNKANAIKTLSSNISKNLTKYNETKEEVKTSVKNIRQNLKPSNVNIVNAESEYISLNGNMSERYIYLCNIYDNLEQAYILISGSNYTSEQNNSSTISETTQKSTQENTDNPGKMPRFKKNIDSYAPITNNNTESKTSETQTEESNEETDTNKSNIDSFVNNIPPKKNEQVNPYYPSYNNYYGYNNMPNGYGYGYNYQNGYNGYGYQNGNFRRFNPNRNTDSFYPYNKNIDTYRPMPNINYPVTTAKIDNNKENEVKENGVIKLDKENEFKIN